MKKIDCFALLVYNSHVKTTRLIGLYESRALAESMLKVELEKNFNKKKFNLYIEECSISLKKKLINDDLIIRCYNIANCLYLADRCFLKGQFDKCSLWQNVALFRSSAAAFLLHDDI